MKQSETESLTNEISAAPSVGLERRKMLLSSLGKGSAVIAAVTVPMQSLAAIGTLSLTANGKRCTISGTMSNAHSGETVTATCAGKSQGYYHKIDHWPGYTSSNTDPTISVTGGTSTFTQNTNFNSLFGAGPSVSLISVMPGNTNHTTYQDESHWVCALLNGTSGSLAVNFPYTAQEVINLYVADGTTRSNALAFFAGYMETI